MENLTMSNELQSLLLNGGKIVFTDSLFGKTTILVRMPKGKEIKDDRIGKENNSFEYVYAQNYLNDSILDVAGYQKGGLREVKKRTYQEHLDIVAPVIRKLR